MINHLSSTGVEQQKQWIRSLLAHDSSSLLGKNHPWFNRLRHHAEDTITRLPLIERKQEFWRYSLTDKLFKEQYKPINIKKEYFSYKNSIPKLSSDSFKLVFVNGHLNTELSDNVGQLPKGLIVGSLHDVLKKHFKLVEKYFVQLGNHNDHLFTVLNTALMNYGVFIYIDKHVEMTQPIEILYFSSPNDNNPQPKLNMGEKPDSQMSTLRNIIILEEGAKASLVERYSGYEKFHYFNNNLTDVILNEGATLKHTLLQDESRSAFHLSNVFLNLGINSDYKGLHFSLGGDWSRMDYKVNFTETGAKCDLKGLYIVGDQQLNDVHLDIAHHVPDCSSTEHFKGILYGQGRAVFDGHVVVEKYAQHSAADMKNDNLILCDKAEVDTKPQLEIYADDVKCSHGTTVGQLDEEQLFYLRSRGINEIEAKSLLCQGFASEIIDEVEDPVLRQVIKDKLNKLLNHTESLMVVENAS